MMITPTDFERRYAADSDPWRVADSWYEQRKLTLALAILSRQRYRDGWDAACGTGHLAAGMAGRCERLTASDASPTACDLTRQRLVDFGSAKVLPHRLPDLPTGDGWPLFDLVVLSEVCYYLAPAERERMPQMLDATTDGRGAEIVSVSWRHHPDDAYLSGSAATEELGLGLIRLGWEQLVGHEDKDFVMRSWHRTAGGVR